MASLQELTQAARNAEVNELHAQQYVRTLMRQHSLAGDAVLSASQQKTARGRFWQTFFGGALLGSVAAAAAIVAVYSVGPRAYLFADVIAGLRAPQDNAARVVSTVNPVPAASSVQVVRYGAHVVLAADLNARIEVVAMSARETVMRIAGGLAAARVPSDAGHTLVVITERGVVRLAQGEIVVGGTEPPMLLSGTATWHEPGEGAEVAPGEARGSKQGAVALVPQAQVFASAEHVVSAVRAYRFVYLAPTGAPTDTSAASGASPGWGGQVPTALPLQRQQNIASAAAGDLAAPNRAAGESQWRRVRLLRGQARYEEALVVAQELVRSKDPVWAPIAALEMARIQLGPLGNAAAAQTLLADWLASYPHHPLNKQAQQMLCQAAAQVGKRLPSCASTP